ncbi:MAG: hypothetical protein DMF86_15570 [Acidobacteria bacterium]|nr:MAG: hypothetical protein DMF86_15570 [Acidobacteriota bacterium]
MRRIVAFNRVSADGYFATADGNLGWVVPDQEIDKLGGEAVPGSDNMILFGRRTYDMFESFWPHVVGDSPTAPDPHAPGRQSPELRAMGVWINEATKVVFSRTRKGVTWKNSRLLHDEALKREPGRDIMIFGSGSIASQLTEHGLIDEYQFIAGPLLLGCGRSLLSGVPKTVKLNLLEAKPYPSGNVMLRYARAK